MRLEDCIRRLEEILTTVKPEGETLELHVDLRNLLGHLTVVVESKDVRSVVSAWDLVLKLTEREISLEGIDLSDLNIQLRSCLVGEGDFHTAVLLSF